MGSKTSTTSVAKDHQTLTRALQECEKSTHISTEAAQQVLEFARHVGDRNLVQRWEAVRRVVQANTNWESLVFAVGNAAFAMCVAASVPQPHNVPWFTSAEEAAATNPQNRVGFVVANSKVADWQNLFPHCRIVPIDFEEEGSAGPDEVNIMLV